jgi:hypothetical protein
MFPAEPQDKVEMWEPEPGLQSVTYRSPATRAKASLRRYLLPPRQARLPGAALPPGATAVISGRFRRGR